MAYNIVLKLFGVRSFIRRMSMIGFGIRTQITLHKVAVPAK